MVQFTIQKYIKNIKDFKSSLGVFGDTYTVNNSTFHPFTRHSAAQISSHDSEATNLNDVPSFVYPALWDEALPYC
jgi:hypothetical protein